MFYYKNLGRRLMEMKAASPKRQLRSMLVWLCIVSQVVMLVLGRGETSAKWNQQKNCQELASCPPLQLQTHNQHVVLDNGLVKVNLSTPEGLLTGIEYGGIDNLLEYQQKGTTGGYWDVVWSSRAREGVFEPIEGTHFKVIAQDENQIELSFSRRYDLSLDLNNSFLPLNIDKRFIMLRGQSGFYTYAIFERLEGWPELDIGEARVAFKLQEDLFHYMAISDTIQRIMPTARDRMEGQILDYKEAVLLTNPSNPALKGEVDDKYQYSKENEDNHVHGWICSNPHVGFWVIIPSSEFRSGGPKKQELTSHAGPTSLGMFYSRHYAGSTFMGLKFEEGEPWKKVLGPIFIYLNSNSSTEDPRELWKDAKEQMLIETQKWPYDFPVSDDFPVAAQRGTVRGRLLVRDRYIKRNQFPAKSAYVGLAPPGDSGSWQFNAKGYQFWNQTDDKGYFTLSSVRAGNYNLYGWVPGILGEYKYEVEIDLRPGSEFNLGNLVFSPPRVGPTLWEIGIPDRTAAEFYVPEPDLNLVNKLYLQQPTDRFRQYGLWERYADLYPDHDLVYRVGVSNYKKDWFFAHVNRKTGNNTYETTTWQISFNLPYVIPRAFYTFRVALASSNLGELQGRVNEPNALRPHFGTRPTGRDNAIARHGIHGLYWSFTFNIQGYRLRTGNNTIYLKQAKGGLPFTGLMYDYLRLEGPQGYY